MRIYSGLDWLSGSQSQPILRRLKLVVRRETALVAIGTALLVTAILELPGRWPVKVHAQVHPVSTPTPTVSDPSSPSCAISSVPTTVQSGLVTTPGFVCIADLDGNGTKQIVVGMYRQVVIIDNTGAVRNTATLPW